MLASAIQATIDVFKIAVKVRFGHRDSKRRGWVVVEEGGCVVEY
jgi:hypothetical protein